MTSSRGLPALSAPIAIFMIVPFHSSGTAAAEGSDRLCDTLQNVKIAGDVPGGAADEEAVDMRLSDQFFAIAGIDAAAIEHRHAPAERRFGDVSDALVALVGIV
ncbi:hypothetical protein D9M70_539010 [compost metagenome]